MPNRIIREGINTSHRLDQIADDPGCEVFYRRIFSIADDFGRYHAVPTLLRSAAYPLRIDKITDAQITQWLSACESAGLIHLYRVNGKPYLEIVDFRQQLRSKKSKFPAPDEHLTRTCLADDAQMNSGMNAPVEHSHIMCIADAQHMSPETETEAEAEAETGHAQPLDAFFEERYRRHPKKKDRVLAEHQFCSVPGIRRADTQDAFRRGHEAWVASEDWRWKGGVKAPTFAEFISDRGWQYLPPESLDGPQGATRKDPNGAIAAALKMFYGKDVA